MKRRRKSTSLKRRKRRAPHSLRRESPEQT
jgi:hypothetical protein